MKKRNLNSLTLNKRTVSNLKIQNSVVGGFKTESCQPAGICCPTHDINCPEPSADGNCTGTGTGTATADCPRTVSCPGVGIC